jgi:predicted secreted hydrolase
MRVDNWSIQGINGQDHLIASMQNFAIDLKLASRKPPVLHNGNGLITLGQAGSSYYYSRTRMEITGTINDHGQSLSVGGLAWMDHQWGNFLVLGNGGWDWYSLQLDNQTELMLYVFHDPAGHVSSTYAGYIDTEGKDHLLNEKSLTLTPLATWTSPQTGIVYPSGWQLTINDPQLRTTLTLTPQLKNQELVALASTGNVYWEGAIQIQSEGVSGRGYIELTGYHRQ